MATVTTGVGYGLFTLAKRYVVPMISPPTPPQIEQDKTAIDAEFTKAFALIDQLATDTAALKSAEEERTEKLDSALSEVESVIAELKAANKKREDDAARTGDEIRALREMIPKALEGWKSDGDNRLKELNTELKSLKMLVGNRVGSSAPNTTRTTSGTSTPAAATSSTATEHQNQQPALSSTASAPAPGITTPRKDSPFSFEGRSGRTIPAWQKAAAEKEKENEKAAQSSVTDAGTSEANADV
jgi:peroxin-14